MNDFQRFLEAQRQASGGAPAGPGAFLARAVGMVAAVGLLALSLVFGAFVLTALLAVALVGGIALRVWLWWQQRKFRSAANAPGSGPGPRPRAPHRRPDQGDIVEGEFEVVSEGDDDAPRA